MHYPVFGSESYFVSLWKNLACRFPFSDFLRTGGYEYSDGKVYYRTTGGRWWSATRSSATYANCLYTGTTVVAPQNSLNRGDGFAVRCVAR